MAISEKLLVSNTARRVNGHFGAVLLLLSSALVVIGIWIAVQASRSDPLPTLLWSGKLSDAEVMTASPMVLDRLGGGWWWVYAAPKDRHGQSEPRTLISQGLPILWGGIDPPPAAPKAIQYQGAGGHHLSIRELS